jgi:protein-S-isoprenylcysteine O-methyltransferase Ste14
MNDRLTAIEGTKSGGAALVTGIGRFVFRYRDYLAPFGLILIFVCSSPHPVFGSERVDWWFNLFGLLVALLGQAIRVSVIGYAYIVRGGSKKQLAAPKLVCEGFYAHSRNPMYVGNFLLLGGLAIIYHSPLVYLVVLPLYLLSIVAIIEAEEEFLRGKFGAEYEDYCRRVNRFLPSLRGLRTTLSGMKFDWRRVLRKEYGTTFAWLSTALIFIAVERISWHPARQVLSALARIAVAWILVALLYGITRWLKKSGRLTSAP